MQILAHCRHSVNTCRMAWGKTSNHGFVIDFTHNLHNPGSSLVKWECSVFWMSLPLHSDTCYVIKGNCGQVQASLEGEASPPAGLLWNLKVSGRPMQCLPGGWTFKFNLNTFKTKLSVLMSQHTRPWTFSFFGAFVGPVLPGAQLPNGWVAVISLQL